MAPQGDAISPWFDLKHSVSINKVRPCPWILGGSAALAMCYASHYGSHWFWGSMIVFCKVSPDNETTYSNCHGLIDDFPIRTASYGGFPIAMFDYCRVNQPKPLSVPRHTRTAGGAAPSTSLGCGTFQAWHFLEISLPTRPARKSEVSMAFPRKWPTHVLA